jgi:hypothetical protein
MGFIHGENQFLCGGMMITKDTMTITRVIWRKQVMEVLQLTLIKHVFVSGKVVFEKPFFKFFYIYLLLEKLVNGKYFPVNEKHFPVKEKFGLVSRKVFYFYFDRKHFTEVVKNLEMSYYLLIISNLILKLLIAVYILF